MSVNFGNVAAPYLKIWEHRTQDVNQILYYINSQTAHGKQTYADLAFINDSNKQSHCCGVYFDKLGCAIMAPPCVAVFGSFVLQEKRLSKLNEFVRCFSFEKH
ncbi:hypothetical protein NQ317_015203 [Molorchus minor]|uniref:Uncharacterized protein n=1 Tax=Molorchus minor TaxID=1323400 RepID=A0ABQ9JD35_9CUCU|nr:hypothetical protein NQ317_015203 [Molorchus minor]